MSLSLFDDNDWEAWQREQEENASLGSLLSPEMGMPSAPPPMAAYQPPPHAEMAPLKLDTGPDWSDALGAGTTALAALADLGLNHGRGTGQILAAGGQFGQARAEQRLRGTQDALNYEEKRAQLEKSNRYNDYLYASMAQRGQLGQERLGQAGERIAVSKQNAGTKASAEARQAENDDPTEFIAWAKDKGYDLTGLQTMTQARSAMGPLMKEWDLEHAGEKAQDTRAGALRADIAAAPQTNEIAADRARGVEEATEPGAIRKIEAGAIAKARAEREATGDKKMGNVEIVDPEVYSSLGTKQVNDANDIARSKVQFEKSMNDMAGIERRVQGFKIVPGGDKSAWETAQSGAIGSLTKLFETGVINEQEYKRYVERIPGPGISAAGLMGKTGEVIAATRDELSGIFDAGLSQYGVRGKKAGAQQPTAAEAGGASNYGPDADHPSNLGVTDTVPRFRATPGGGAATARGGQMGPVGGMASGSTAGGGVPMRTPSGNVGMVPPDKVQAAIAAGWRPAQ